jgi:preprotein translocase subunit SecA
LGGQDPLARFTTEITAAFHRLGETIEDGILAALDDISVKDGIIDFGPVPPTGPSSTWTYLVNDDPFQNQIGRLLSGPGRATFAIGGALFAMPLMILWGLVDKLARRWRKA